METWSSTGRVLCKAYALPQAFYCVSFLSITPLTAVRVMPACVVAQMTQIGHGLALDLDLPD
jgi:hypothetical protein